MLLIFASFMHRQGNSPLTQDTGLRALVFSGLTYIDGDQGVLLHRGFPIEQLADQSDFLEVAYLLLNGELPNKTERDKFVTSITKPYNGA